MREVTEHMVERDGKLIINRSQDVTALLEQNAYEAKYGASMVGDAKFRKIGSIPFVVAEQWSRECGASIGSQEFSLYVRRKLLDGDFAKLRVKDQ